MPTINKLNPNTLFRSSWAFSCLLLINFSHSLHAADVVSHLPDTTLGYAVVRDIAATDQKVARLISLFHPDLPSPLNLARSITGLSQGIDYQGDALFAYLANNSEPALPVPLALLPVADYEILASAIGGDASGEICRVSIAEVELLIAQLGNFALVMNVEHREVMQQILARQTEVAPNTFTEWIARNNVSFVLTRLGFAQIMKHGWFVGTTDNSPLADDPFGALAVTDQGALQNSWPLMEFVRKYFREAGVGLAVDNANNVRIRWKGDFLNQRKAVEESGNGSQQRLKGFAAEPYAIAGAGDMPHDAGAFLAELMTNLSIQDAPHQGRSEFTPQDWAAERKSWDLTLADVQSVSVLVVPPTEGEPLLSTFFARLTVDDSQKYLAALAQSYEIANELTLRSKSEIKMIYNVHPTKIGDVEGVAITSDLDKATGDQNVDVWQALLTACLGAEHNLTIYCAPVDDQHVFIGLQSTEKLLKFIDGFQKGNSGLESDASVQKSLALLSTEGAYIQLVNPQGLVELGSSWMKTLLVLGMVPQLPLYPTAPPLALAVSSDQNGWQAEVGLPAESVQALAEFVSEVGKVFGQ